MKHKNQNILWIALVVIIILVIAGIYLIINRVAFAPQSQAVSFSPNDYREVNDYGEIVLYKNIEKEGVAYTFNLVFRSLEDYQSAFEKQRTITFYLDQMDNWQARKFDGTIISIARGSLFSTLTQERLQPACNNHLALAPAVLSNVNALIGVTFPEKEQSDSKSITIRGCPYFGCTEQPPCTIVVTWGGLLSQSPVVVVCTGKCKSDPLFPFFPIPICDCDARSDANWIAGLTPEEVCNRNNWDTAFPNCVRSGCTRPI